MPIGVFDSGLGGLTVLRALVDAQPAQPFVYFGDNANAPYGDRPPEDVARLTRAGVETLFTAGCRLVIVACNTAAALGLRPLQQDWLPDRQDGAEPPLRVLGVFAPIVEALSGRDWAAPPLGAGTSPAAAESGGPAADAPALRALFFATPATVASGAFEREVAARAPSVSVMAEPCPGLADALEAGAEDRAAALAAAACARAKARLGGGTADAAVLGCTHYPLAAKAFRRALPPETPLLNQPGVVAASLARYLARRPAYEERPGPAQAPRLRCLTSGEPDRVGALASTFFGGPLKFETCRKN